MTDIELRSGHWERGESEMAAQVEEPDRIIGLIAFPGEHGSPRSGFVNPHPQGADRVEALCSHQVKHPT